jgi:hypothetical protein
MEVDHSVVRHGMISHGMVLALWGRMIVMIAFLQVAEA